MEDAQVAAMLVRRCLAGDASAWEEIVQRYHRRIYNICYRFAGRATMPRILPKKSSLKCIVPFSPTTSSAGRS